MRQLASKFLRDNLDARTIKEFKKVYPHFQFEHRFRRMPLYPKIVLYSNLSSVDRFIEQIFPTFRVINPKPSSQSDEAFTREIASDVFSTDNLNAITTGVIIRGFPFNTNQALLLDRFFYGVNLALHVKGESVSQDFSSLLKYYDERGTLLELDYKDNLTPEELQRLHTKIILGIKSSD